MDKLADSDGDEAGLDTILGKLIQILFILLNVVIMLNFVIALLSNTFIKYFDVKDGLYHNVLN